MGAAARDPTGVASSQPDTLRLLADQITAVQRTLPATIAGNLLLAAVLAWALRGVVPAGGLALWVACVVVHCVANAWVLNATRKRATTPRNAPRRAAAAVRSAGVLGLVWAGGILWLWPAGEAALGLASSQGAWSVIPPPPPDGVASSPSRSCPLCGEAAVASAPPPPRFALAAVVVPELWAVGSMAGFATRGAAAEPFPSFRDMM